jgi:hypothetical protein
MIFPPVPLSAQSDLIDVADAWKKVAHARFGDAVAAALTPSAAGFQEANAAIAQAQHDMIDALSTGALAAFVNIEATSELFAIPSAYWRLDESDASLSGVFSARSHSGLPPKLSNQPVFVSKSAVERWRKGAALDQERKLPAAPTPKLKAWYEKLRLRDVRDGLSEDVVVAQAKADFPQNSVSRQAVRDLRGSQKRGPKGYRGQFTAK